MDGDGGWISTMAWVQVVPSHELHIGFMTVGELLDGLVVELHQRAQC